MYTVPACHSDSYVAFSPVDNYLISSRMTKMFYLQVVITSHPGSSFEPLIMVPTVSIPVNTTGCQTPPPSYSNHSLVSICQVTPLIARSVFVPTGIQALQCTSSPPPNCTTITCLVPSTHDSVAFKIEPCYSPPAITMDNYINGSNSAAPHHTFSHSLKFNFSSSKVPLTVTLTQHTSPLSMGFKVMMLMTIALHNNTCNETVSTYLQQGLTSPDKCLYNN